MPGSMLNTRVHLEETQSETVANGAQAKAARGNPLELGRPLVRPSLIELLDVSVVETASGMAWQ